MGFLTFEDKMKRPQYNGERTFEAFSCTSWNHIEEFLERCIMILRYRKTVGLSLQKSLKFTPIQKIRMVEDLIILWYNIRKAHIIQQFYVPRSLPYGIPTEMDGIIP